MSLFLLFAPCDYAQNEPLTIHFGMGKGLPTDVILDIKSAPDGYIYLGTTLGLFRYNGTKFQPIPLKNQSSNTIYHIRFSDDGTLYCQNFSNQILYLQNDTLQPFEEANKLREESSFIFILEIVKNELIVDVKSTKIIAINLKKNENNTYPHRTIYIDNAKKGIIEAMVDKKGNLYYSGYYHFYVISPTGEEKLLPLPAGMGLREGFNNHFLGFYPPLSPASGKKNELYEISEKGEIKTHLLPIANLHFPRVVEDGSLWLCTSDGVLLLDSQTFKVKKHFLKGINTSGIACDREGNYWISTQGKGLYFVPNLNVHFFSLPNEDFRTHTPYSFAEGENKTLFIGTEKGYAYEMDSLGTFKYRYESSPSIRTDILNYLPSKKILFAFQEAWTYETKKWIMANQRLRGNYKDVAVDWNENLWIATSGSADIYAEKPIPLLKEKEVDANFQMPLLTRYSLRSIRSRSIIKDPRRKRIWVAYSDNLYMYNANYQPFIIKNVDGNSLFCTDLVWANTDMMWATTVSHGVVGIGDTLVRFAYNETNGLPSNSCSRIRFYQEKLYLLSGNSLVVINPQLRTVVNYSQLLGLENIQLFDIWLYQEKIYLATNQGVLLIPINITANLISPKTNILKLTVEKSIYSPQTENIFPHYNNNVQIHFEAISFKTLGSFQYEYRLLGSSDTLWIRQNSDISQVNFSALTPGTYTFEVRAFISFSNIRSNIARTTFTILAPWWKRKWAIALELLILSAIVFGLIRWQMKNYQEEQDKILASQKLEQALTHSQLTALRAQMNPHFMYNVLNSLQSFIYLEQQDEASHFLGKFSDLMRKTLDMSDKKEVTLKEEIDALKLYIELEKLRIDESLEVSIEIQPNLDLFNLYIPSMIIQPYIENAFKHGLLHKKGDKKLWVAFYLEENNTNILTIIIEDNGVGRQKSAEINQRRRTKTASFATKAIQKRIELINQQKEAKILIEIIDKVNEQKEAEGTKVILQIPV